MEMPKENNKTPITKKSKIDQGSWGYGKIISTHYIKFEDDLIDFVDTL